MAAGLQSSPRCHSGTGCWVRSDLQAIPCVVFPVRHRDALENLPFEARGLASGILQQGYAVGYLLATVINLTLVPGTSASWRSLFWTASGISLFAAVIRAVLPESEVFLRAKAVERAKGTDTTKKTKIFVKEIKEMLKMHWLLCIYAVLLMTGQFELHFVSRADLPIRLQFPVAWFPGRPYLNLMAHRTLTFT